MNKSGPNFTLLKFNICSEECGHWAARIEVSNSQGYHGFLSTCVPKMTLFLPALQEIQTHGKQSMQVVITSCEQTQVGTVSTIGQSHKLYLLSCSILVSCLYKGSL